MIGHWTECSVELDEHETLKDCDLKGGKLISSAERTWFIIKPETVNPKDFFDVTLSLSEKYDQSAFIAKLGSTCGVYNGENGSLLETIFNLDESVVSNALENIIILRQNKRFGYGWSVLTKLRSKGRLQNIVFSTNPVRGELYTGKIKSTCFAVEVPAGNISSLQAFAGMELYYQ